MDGDCNDENVEKISRMMSVLLVGTWLIMICNQGLPKDLQNQGTLIGINLILIFVDSFSLAVIQTGLS